TRRHRTHTGVRLAKTCVPPPPPLTVGVPGAARLRTFGHSEGFAFDGSIAPRNCCVEAFEQRIKRGQQSCGPGNRACDFEGGRNSVRGGTGSWITAVIHRTLQRLSEVAAAVETQRAAELEEQRDHRRPPGLMTGSQAAAIVAVEVLVERNQIAPLRI